MPHDPTNRGCHFDPNAFTQGGNEYTDFCMCPRSREELARMEERNKPRPRPTPVPSNGWDTLKGLIFWTAVVVLVYVVRTT